MVRYAGARRRGPRFMPEIVSFRVVNAFERALHALRKVHDFRGRFNIQTGEIRSVLVGHDHHVASGVGKSIQDDEDFFPRRTMSVSSSRLAAGKSQNMQPTDFAASTMYR